MGSADYRQKQRIGHATVPNYHMAERVGQDVRAEPRSTCRKFVQSYLLDKISSGICT